MGVDFCTNRSRIGAFSSDGNHLTIFLLYVVSADTSEEVWSIVVISILLLIAGIEPNPGPNNETTTLGYNISTTFPENETTFIVVVIILVVMCMFYGFLIISIMKDICMRKCHSNAGTVTGMSLNIYIN